MKRVKKVKFKTTVVRRGRTKTTYTPLLLSEVRPSDGRLQQSEKSEQENEGQSSGFSAQFDDLQTNHQPGKGKDSFRKSNSFLNWQKASGQIFRAFVENCCLPEESTCVVCGVAANIRCPECGPCSYYCRDCAYSTHKTQNQFHFLDLWQDNNFIPFYPDHGILGYGHQCPTKHPKLFTLIDSYGRHHSKYVEVCSCESIVATLARLNFWPGSPEKPTVAFHISLMRLCEKLFLQCQVSLFNFVEVLKSLLPPLHPSLVVSIYNILNSGCFEEFRHFSYQCNTLVREFSNLDNGSICPLCPENNGVLIESMDACMGLIRKKSKGSRQTGRMRHSSILFADQEEVDVFVDDYSNEGTEVEKDCSRFQAGEVLSSLRLKGKNQLFDEKGVFGRVCRHDYPKGFLNLKYGERIAYSLYELRRLKSTVGNNVSVVVMYDIACILHKHIKGTNQENLLEGVDLCIPIFHCYGHKASCQIKYNPRRTEGVGLTDGEGVERLWSFLREFSKMTKEMAADKRHDVLTDGLLIYGLKLRNKFGISLKGKLKRAESLLQETEGKMKELGSSLPVPYSVSLVKEWQSMELETISPKEKILELQWNEQYTDLLIECKKLRNQLVYATTEDKEKVNEVKGKQLRNEKALVGIEKKHKVKKRWMESDLQFQSSKKTLLEKRKSALRQKMQRISAERLFLLEMKKKYADGQSIAIKLAKQISRVTDILKKNILSYNEMGGTLVFDNAKDPNNSVYNDNKIPIENIPNSVKAQLIDLSCLQDRCAEEIALVKGEMVQLISFHFLQINTIDNYICEQSSDSLYEQGLRSLLAAKKLALQSSIGKLISLWEDLKVLPYQCHDVVTWTTFNENTQSPETENTDETDDMFELSYDDYVFEDDDETDFDSYDDYQ